MHILWLLLRRDLLLQPEALVMPAILGLLLSACVFAYHLAGLPLGRLAPAFIRAAFGIGTFLGLAQHLRAVQEGTLPLLRSLPIDPVHEAGLRWSEALLLGLGMALCAAVPALAVVPPGPLLRAFADPLLGWILLWTFALPLPLVLRWGPRRLGWYGLVFLLGEAWGAGYIPQGPDLDRASGFLQTVAAWARTAHRTWDACAGPWGLLHLLLLTLSLVAAFRLSRLALEHADA